MASSRDKGRHKMNIRKDDIVEVMAGKDKGKRGKVLEVFPKRGLAIVEKANIVKRHTRPSQRQRQGGSLRKKARFRSPISCSCVRRQGSRAESGGRSWRMAVRFAL